MVKVGPFKDNCKRVDEGSQAYDFKHIVCSICRGIDSLLEENEEIYQNKYQDGCSKLVLHS